MKYYYQKETKKEPSGGWREHYIIVNDNTIIEGWLKGFDTNKFERIVGDILGTWEIPKSAIELSSKEEFIKHMFIRSL